MPPAPGAQFALVVGAQPRELVPGLRAVDRTEQRRILDAGVHGVRVSRQPDQPRQREQGRITQRASPVARPAVARLKSGGVQHRRTRRPVRRSAPHGLQGDHTRHRPATRRRSAIAGSGRRHNPRFIGPRLTSAPPRVSPCLVAPLSSGEPERVVAQRTTSRDSARHQPLAAQSVPQAVGVVRRLETAQPKKAGVAHPRNARVGAKHRCRRAQPKPATCDCRIRPGPFVVIESPALHARATTRGQ